MSKFEVKKIIKMIFISIAFVLPILFTNCINEVFSSSKSLLDVNLFEIKNGWQILVPETGEWITLEKANGTNIYRTSDIVTMKLILPETRQRGSFLFIKTRYRNLEAYCEGSIIYSCGCMNLSCRRRTPGYHWHNIPINETQVGKDIIIKMHPSSKRISLNTIVSYIGTPSAFFIIMLKSDLKVLVPGFILLLTGIFTLLIYFFKRRRVLIILPLSMFSLSVGFHSIAVTSIAKDFIYNNPTFWYYTINVTNYLIPIFFLMAVQLIFKGKKHRLINYLWIFLLVFASISIIADAFNLFIFYSTSKLYIALLTIIIPISSVIIYISAAEGNIYHKILRNCYTILLLSGVADIATTFIHNKPADISLISFGTLFFLTAVFFLLERSIYEAEKKISSFSNEIKQKDATLVENKKLLQQTLETEKMKSEFFSNVSHEFRTPLNILLSNLQLMNHYVKTGDIKSDTKDISKYMGTMKQNCYRLLRLINNLIDITKIDSGYMHPIMKNCDIVKEIKDIVLSISEYAASKGLALNFHSDKDSFITSCDPEKMERILLNLLSNAVKFTNKGGTITVSMNCSTDKIIITVSDTGIGIPADKLPSIFDRFNQVDMSLSKNYEGSGIGLSLVRSLIKMHDGNISVQSEPQKGSDFIITLPAKLVNEDQTDANSALTVQKCFNESINIEFSDITK